MTIVTRKAIPHRTVLRGIVLSKLGVQTDRIGDSTGQLEELSAL